MHSYDLSSAESAVNVAGIATDEILVNYQNPSLTCLVIGLRERSRLDGWIDWMDGSTGGGCGNDFEFPARLLCRK